MKIANEYEDVARRHRTAQQVQAVVQELYQSVNGTGLEVMTPRRFCGDWLKGKKGTVEEKTFHTYNHLLNLWLEFLGEKADAPLQRLVEEDIRQWRDHRRKEVSTTTVNIGLRVIRMFLEDACKRDLMGSNPAVRVNVLKRTNSVERQPFRIQDIQRLLPHLPEEWKSLVLFGLYTGQRLGDLVRLRWSDIDWTANEIRLTTKKTGRAQKIPIALPLLKYLNSFPKQNGSTAPVHPKAFATAEAQKGSVSTLSRQFYELMATAGLVPRRDHQKKDKNLSKAGNQHRKPALTFHCFRHTLTSMLKNAGVSGAIAEEIVGHNSPEMNRIYTHIEQTSLANAMALLPDVSTGSVIKLESVSIGA